MNSIDNIHPGTNDSKADDPFDLNALRLPEKLVQVRRRRLVMPVKRKPNRHDFVRVNSDPAYTADMALFKSNQVGDDEEMYAVHPTVLSELENEYRRYTLHTAVTLNGDGFLWAVPKPIDDDRENTWLTTNREAARLAMEKWVRVASDKGAGAYCVHEYEGPPIEPRFPTEAFSELVRLAFKNRIIDQPDHPMILRLRGLS